MKYPWLWKQIEMFDFKRFFTISLHEIKFKGMQFKAARTVLINTELSSEQQYFRDAATTPTRPTIGTPDSVKKMKAVNHVILFIFITIGARYQDSIKERYHKNL